MKDISFIETLSRMFANLCVVKITVLTQTDENETQINENDRNQSLCAAVPHFVSVFSKAFHF